MYSPLYTSPRHDGSTPVINTLFGEIVDCDVVVCVAPIIIVVVGVVNVTAGSCHGGNWSRLVRNADEDAN